MASEHALAAFTVRDPTEHLPVEVLLESSCQGVEAYSVKGHERVVLWPWSTVHEIKGSPAPHTTDGMDMLTIELAPEQTAEHVAFTFACHDVAVAATERCGVIALGRGGEDRAIASIWIAADKGRGRIRG